MRCSESQEAIEAYVDGEIDACSRAELELHVESCRACAAQVEKAKALKSAFASLPQRRAPGGFAPAVMEAIGRERVADPAKRRLPVSIAAAVSVVMSVAAGTLAWAVLGGGSGAHAVRALSGLAGRGFDIMLGIAGLGVDLAGALVMLSSASTDLTRGIQALINMTLLAVVLGLIARRRIFIGSLLTLRRFV
ncbi:MAG: anti-sigma factor family protein [Candidatus Aquicultorales bacterium]